jgi:hypothetical protein
LTFDLTIGDLKGFACPRTAELVHEGHPEEACRQVNIFQYIHLVVQHQNLNVKGTLEAGAFL